MSLTSEKKHMLLSIDVYNKRTFSEIYINSLFNSYSPIPRRRKMDDKDDFELTRSSDVLLHNNSQNKVYGEKDRFFLNKSSSFSCNGPYARERVQKILSLPKPPVLSPVGVGPGRIRAGSFNTIGYHVPRNRGYSTIRRRYCRLTSEVYPADPKPLCRTHSAIYSNRPYNTHEICAYRHQHHYRIVSTKVARVRRCCSTLSVNRTLSMNKRREVRQSSSLSFFFFAHSTDQKQPSRDVFKKRCSENMQQIYRGTPMKSHFGMDVLL